MIVGKEKGERPDMEDYDGIDLGKYLVRTGAIDDGNDEALVLVAIMGDGGHHAVRADAWAYETCDPLHERLMDDCARLGENLHGNGMDAGYFCRPGRKCGCYHGDREAAARSAALWRKVFGG